MYTGALDALASSRLDGSRDGSRRDFAKELEVESLATLDEGDRKRELPNKEDKRNF